MKNTVYSVLQQTYNNYEEYIQGNIDNQNRRNRNINELLLKVSKIEDVKLRFFIFNGNKRIGNESLTSFQIKALMKTGFINLEKIHYPGNTEKVYNKIKECDLMISTRLHASIFACFAGIPFLLVEYHRKCTDFLNDIGQNSKYRLYDADVNMEEILYCIQDILNNNYVSPKNVEMMKNKALLNFTETIK